MMRGRGSQYRQGPPQGYGQLGTKKLSTFLFWAIFAAAALFLILFEKSTPSRQPLDQRQLGRSNGPVAAQSGLRNLDVFSWNLSSAPAIENISHFAKGAVKSAVTLLSPGQDPANVPGVGSSGSIKRPSLAIVLPFYNAQVPKVVQVLESWEQLPPCSPPDWLMSGGANVDLVFVFDGDATARSTRHMAGLLQRQVASASYAQCFQAVRLMGFNFTAAVRHFDGAALTFYGLFPSLQDRYDNFLLTESDIRPVREGWLRDLVQAAQTVNCEQHWQLGSPPMCNVAFGELDKRVDYHINGNSFYALGCPAFDRYLDRARRFYPGRGLCNAVGGCATGDRYEDGYDHVLYRFRMHPANYAYTRWILQHFGYTHAVLNYCEDIYSPAAVPSQTALVHSKAVYFSEEEVVLRRAFAAVLGRMPTAPERCDLYITLRTGEHSYESLLDLLCTSRLYGTPQTKALRGVCRGRPRPSWSTRLGNRTYVWSVDLHAGPISCNIPIFKEIDVAVHAEVDFSNCHYFGLCKKRLRVLAFDDWRGFSLDPDPEGLKRKFHEAYAHDRELARVDVVICSHPAANCELFLSLDKALVVYATTRLEFGRNDAGIAWRVPYVNNHTSPLRWRQWVKTVIDLGARDDAVVAANNLYDALYIKWHTGVDAEVIPSWCGNNDLSYGSLKCRGDWHGQAGGGLTYTPVKDSVLIGPYRTNLGRVRFQQLSSARDSPIMRGLFEAVRRSREEERGARDTGFDFLLMGSDVTKDPQELLLHQAIVLVPYQVSTISIFEYYRMNVPLFAPSVDLLCRWHAEHGILWERIYGWPGRQVDLIDPQGLLAAPDPNDDSPESFLHWIQYSDWYVMPHITLYDSWDDLIDKIAASNLQSISDNMRVVNAQQREALKQQWRKVFGRLRAAKAKSVLLDESRILS